MMFFSKFFAKSFEQNLTKGDSLFHAERYSEARQYYLDALEKMPDAADPPTRSSIELKISRCANLLAEMNIAEAEAAIRSGNLEKAGEYLELSLELADDVAVREKAEGIIASIENSSSSNTKVSTATAMHNCSSCSSSHHPTQESAPVLPDHLQDHEKYQLLINVLPGDLPQQYASLGEEFASAYLLAHAGDTDMALNKFRQLLSAKENDIILYETALLEFKNGRVDACEVLLRRALEQNPQNPACNMSLAQLFANTGRLDEAARLLQSMMDRQMLFEQALLMLADVYLHQGDQEAAINLLSGGLNMPSLKKASAERLVGILADQGRHNEAAYLVKTYLKGCC